MDLQLVINMLLMVLSVGCINGSSEIHIIMSPATMIRCPAYRYPCSKLDRFTRIPKRVHAHKIVILRFLPGVHTLYSDYKLGYPEYFEMSSFNSSDNPKVIISCKNYSRFNLYRIPRVVIHGINFQGCGGNKFSKVRYLQIYNSKFVHNRGAALEVNRSTNAIIQHVSFQDNSALHCKDSDPQCCLVGGAVRILYSNVCINSSVFINNTAFSGGAIFRYGWGNITIFNSTFEGNKAACNNNNMTCEYGICKSTNYIRNWSKVKGLQMHGGAVTAYGGNNLEIINSTFSKSAAGISGGAVYIIWSRARINHCIFSNNVATKWGGALRTMFNTAFVINSAFVNNSATTGGALDAWRNVTLTVTNSTFSDNKAETGAALWANDNSFLNISFIKVYRNNATYGGVIYIFSSSAILCNSSYSYNNGSLFLFDSNITITGKNNFSYNTGSPNTVTGFQGGAVTAFQSNVVIYGECAFMHNHAQSGGAMHAAESKVWMYNKMVLANNTVDESGGGMHLYQTDLTCHYYCKLKLVNNTALKNGGGIRAVGSSIKVHQGTYCKQNYTDCALPSAKFVGNEANRGGAISLEANAKIYVFTLISPGSEPALNFIHNSADKGGAIYVADETNYGTCSSTSFTENQIITECFLQSLALHYYNKTDPERKSSVYKVNIKSTEFKDNFATRAGQSLHGGLLDRCTVTFKAEIYKSHFYDSHNKEAYPSGRILLSGYSNFLNITTANIDSISSDPVRICFCKQEYPDCNYKPPIFKVKKGHAFNVSLVAVDQVNHTLPNTTIHSSLAYTEGGLGEGQLMQSTKDTCTSLTYSVFSISNREELLLYPDGPCKNANLSQTSLTIEFLPCTCPIGFQQNPAEASKCECECDIDLPPLITCVPQKEYLVRESNIWITFVNSSGSGYLWQPFCPMDYCHPPNKKIFVNLNIINGSDSQCALERSGLLCGTCQNGLSLSLGSSRCIACPSYWPVVCVVIILAALLGGIALVALILCLNLTVAVGSINGIIFYANIVGANKSTFFPFTISNMKFLSTFISWLNLEIGIDTCFFEGIDTYWKMWLQLAFPTYVIVLVVAVIMISNRSVRFSKIIGRKNPVATLATLILLSYTTYLKTIIETLSYSTLKYRDGSQRIVWLPDASITYLSGKHAVLFVVAILILLVGTLYTSLLISWQWLLRYNKIFTNQKLHMFLESYHAPYSSKHRYWTGLLLLVRVILYVISAMNISNNPDINLLVIGIVISMLFLLKGMLSFQIYKRWLIEALELVCYFNIMLFCLAKLFIIIQATKRDQAIIAYVSGSITLLLFVTVGAFHVLTEFCSIEKILRYFKFSQRGQEGESIDLRSDCTSVSGNSQVNQCAPTMSVVDAPTNHGDGDILECSDQLSEPLLTDNN